MNRTIILKLNKPNRARYLIVLSMAIFFTHCLQNTHPLVVNPHYMIHCTSCHGDDLNGLTLGPSLLLDTLKYGSSVTDITRGIEQGFPDKGMPALGQLLSADEMKSLAIWIAERRANTSYADFRIAAPLSIPAEEMRTELVNFKIEVVASGLAKWPYSIEPLPDGSFLLTEKTNGLRIISADGTVSALIKGTPKVYNDGNFEPSGLVHGTGWMLDVKVHPKFGDNGWIYLTHGDRCNGCNEESQAIGRPVSMCRLIRGRIGEGMWIDQEVLWKTDSSFYTAVPETVAGGRIAFDTAGHVFFSVGAKKYINQPPGNLEAYLGIQDLSMPYGKIYRLNDDGSIPQDNPFHQHQHALPSIWTYGHRSPQGLEYDRQSGQLWGTEMGPRGGDEINLLLAGKNYGWPLTSKGMDYDGTKVNYGKDLGIEVDLTTIEQPKVDLTPSPAVSSFIIYQGSQFAEWKNNLIVGSLKATTLYRYVVEGTEVIHEEVLIDDMARIRDIEVGYDGNIYLLLEHTSGGQIVRLVPA